MCISLDTPDVGCCQNLSAGGRASGDLLDSRWMNAPRASEGCSEPRIPFLHKPSSMAVDTMMGLGITLRTFP